MQLDRVTITGADKSIDPMQLVRLSQAYPFVEWGILVSRTRSGSPRFPPKSWLRDLWKLKRESTVPLQLACHAYGDWVMNMLVGGRLFENEMGEYLPMFDRIQWNFHGSLDPLHLGDAAKALSVFQRQMIFQIDGVNDKRLIPFRERGLDIVPLFDTSGGRGIIPDVWPAPLADVYCGYAGGLGPDTLDRQLGRIAHVVGDRTIWIDMERRVRSEDDQAFEVAKVERCLELAKPYVWLTNVSLPA